MIKRWFSRIKESFFLGSKALLKVLVSGWADYLSEEEKQRKNKLDAMNCVAQTVCNVYEMIFNYLISKKIIKGQALLFLKDNGYIKNGKVQFSKRHLAEASNTTKRGNSYSNVLQTMMRVGLVPETAYPWDDENEWDEYYTKAKPSVDKIGQEFLKIFSPAYGYIVKSSFKEYLKISPLMITVFAWVKNENKYGNLYYKPDYIDERNHATTLINIKDPWDVWDSYDPFRKQLHESNYPTWAIYGKVFINNSKYMITENQQFLQDNDLKTVFNNDTGETGYIVHGVLATLGTVEEKINALLDMKNRGILAESGIHIKDSKWKELPKKRFKDL
jgi:hypothetical protein